MGNIKNLKPDTATHPANHSFTGQEPRDEDSAMPADRLLVIQPGDLLPGDVLLYRPRVPNLVQKVITSTTDSPYTHAAIYLGDDLIAEAMFPRGVRKLDIKELLEGSLCVGVLRTQLIFGADRATKLREFVKAVLGRKKFYNAVAAARVPSASKKYFDNQLEFVRQNYGKVTPVQEFAKQSFFCSALVVACYRSWG
jgi:cell wall-associated NlpC family hydrolase